MLLSRSFPYVGRVPDAVWIPENNDHGSMDRFVDRIVVRLR